MTKLEWFAQLWKDMSAKERESVIDFLVHGYGTQFVKTVNTMWRRYESEHKTGTHRTDKELG